MILCGQYRIRRPMSSTGYIQDEGFGPPLEYLGIADGAIDVVSVVTVASL